MEHPTINCGIVKWEQLLGPGLRQLLRPKELGCSVRKRPMNGRFEILAALVMSALGVMALDLEQTVPFIPHRFLSNSRAQLLGLVQVSRIKMAR